ncbi:tubby-related protein 4 [Elysia marginata]|uniref:Tubby-related protein 4 n=1 Tax=Elysia marginata TaxID=1093978 RepID=A0AAV4HDA5_9GAST|nr:tubby-related protein 4 [Elysia marginata]
MNPGLITNNHVVKEILETLPGDDDKALRNNTHVALVLQQTHVHCKFYTYLTFFLCFSSRDPQSYIPDPLRLREFVCSPPPGGERLFCTMIRHGEETSGGHYTLYLEYLGGLVPLLKGKRASKLRPDFVIFDPKIKSSSSSGKGE